LLVLGVWYQSSRRFSFRGRLNTSSSRKEQRELCRLYY